MPRLHAVAEREKPPVTAASVCHVALVIGGNLSMRMSASEFTWTPDAGAFRKRS